MHKVGNLGIFYLNFKKLMDIVISYLSFNSEYHDKCTFTKSYSKLHKNAKIANFVYYGKTRYSCTKHFKQFLQSAFKKSIEIIHVGQH